MILFSALKKSGGREGPLKSVKNMIGRKEPRGINF
jgi:hypothetical protein